VNAKSEDEIRCATLTIHKAGDMTPEGRKKVAEWLRYHAKMIIEEGDNYAARFTGRFTTNAPTEH
jgi:hypothetical protein